MLIVDKDNVVAMFDVKLGSDCLVASDEIQRAVEELRVMKKQISMLERASEQLKEKVKEYLGDKDELVGKDGDIIITYFEAKGADRIDDKHLKAKYPEIYKECLIEGKPSKRFLVK